QALGYVTGFGGGARPRRALPERGDVGDERVDLPRVELWAPARRLVVRARERHVAGAEVEVGRERPHAAQARAEPAHAERADRPVLPRHPAAVDAVAGEAVGGVEALAAPALDPGPLLSRRGGRQREREDED